MQALAYNPNCQASSFLQLIDIPEPQPSNDNVIIKVLGVGVCGSDLLKLNQGLVSEGAILGHEMVGEINQIPEQLSKLYNLQVGDRIISSHHVPCLECDYCLNGQESLCKEFKSTNFIPGAFCEYLALSEGHLKHTVQKVPKHLSNEAASFTEPVACCIKAIRKAKLNQKHKNQNLILGLGSIGLIMGQLLKHYYPDDVVVGCDLNPSRLKLASQLGFSQTIETIDPNSRFNSISLCAGANASIEIACKHANDGASILVFSSVQDSNLGFNNNDIYYKELNIMGSYSPNLIDMQESLELLTRNAIQVTPLITHKASLTNLGTTINQAKSENGIKVYLDLGN